MADRSETPVSEFYHPKYAFEVEVSPAEVREAARYFQTRADSVLGLVGDEAPPKSPYESLTSYRRRLGKLMQECISAFCKKYEIPKEAPEPERVKLDDAAKLAAANRDAALAVFNCENFPEASWDRLRSAEDRVITAGTYLYGRPAGKERQCTRADHTGRGLRYTFGDPAEINAPFHYGTRHVRLNGELFTGENGWEARALREQQASRQDRANAALAREEASAGAAG